MASSLEFNKLIAGILTGGIVAAGAGVVSTIVYNPHPPKEAVYAVAPADDGTVAEEPAIPFATLLAQADVASGEKVAKKCAACHKFEEGGGNGVGPELYGIVGRDKAAMAGFGFSDSLSGMDGSWGYDELDAFLLNPKGYAPGTSMSFAGVRKDQDRADLIAYLASVSPDAPPLPTAEEAPAEESSESEEESSSEN